MKNLYQITIKNPVFAGEDGQILSPGDILNIKEMEFYQLVNVGEVILEYPIDDTYKKYSLHIEHVLQIEYNNQVLLQNLN